MSAQLDAAAKEARKGNFDLKKKKQQQKIKSDILEMSFQTVLK